MDAFQNFSQENYDRLKIFLISNFSMIFQPGDSPEIDESFEITTNSGKIFGKFGSNSLSMTHQNSESEYAKIIEKICVDSPNSKKTQIKNSNKYRDEKPTKDYLSDSKKLYDHILSCDACKKKFLTIQKHMNSL